MKVGIMTYAFMLADELEHLLTHIMNETDAELYLFRHSEHAPVVAVCNKFAANRRTHYYPYGVNHGLGKSANQGLIDGYGDGCDVMLTVNDDISPAPGDIYKIAQGAIENRDCYMVEGAGVDGEDIDVSLAAINPVALETIGYFDENFVPAYYEDTDWHRRAYLAGLPRGVVTDTRVSHVGSASLKQVSKTEHDRQFLRNRGYYVRKWGGDKGAEQFTQPFNNPAFGLKIQQGARHAPYPGHNRGE